MPREHGMTERAEKRQERGRQRVTVVVTEGTKGGGRARQRDGDLVNRDTFGHKITQ